MADSNLIEGISAYDFAVTLSRLEQAIADAGLRLFARIDHAEAAQAFGLEMPQTTVLVYGHPKGGTPIMLEYPDAALDLPLRLLVREKTSGITSVVFRRIEAALEDAGVPGEMARRLSAAQQRVTAVIGIS